MRRTCFWWRGLVFGWRTCFFWGEEDIFLEGGVFEGRGLVFEEREDLFLRREDLFFFEG